MFQFVTEGFKRFFTAKQQREDTYKDVSGQGLLERFVNSNFEELDSYTVPRIENLIANVLDPTTCLAKYIPHLESWLGITVFPAEDNLYIRRKVIRWSRRYYDYKGTKKGLNALFKVINCTVVVSEVWSIYSFDSPVTFDDPDRRFDMGRCSACSFYSLSIAQNFVNLTPAFLRGCYSIILFNHPIGAKLSEATVGGIPIQDEMLNIFVLGGGNPATILGTDGFYVFLPTGTIIPSRQKQANLKVVGGTLYLNIP
jgi:phage tail-like protein